MYYALKLLTIEGDEEFPTSKYHHDLLEVLNKDNFSPEAYSDDQPEEDIIDLVKQFNSAPGVVPSPPTPPAIEATPALEDTRVLYFPKGKEEGEPVVVADNLEGIHSYNTSPTI